MRFIIAALALMAMFSTASALTNDGHIRKSERHHRQLDHCGDDNECSHDCRLGGHHQTICSCPHNWYLMPDGVNCERVSGTECKKIVELNLKDVSHNNLAGLGPDKGLPQSIVYDNAMTLENGVEVKLHVSAVEFYVPKNVKFNGVIPNGDLGMVGIKSGTDVTLKFELFNRVTDELIEPIQSIELRVYDLDTQWTNTNAQETVRFCGASKFNVSQTTTLKVVDHQDGCTTFAAQTYGSFGNNPTTKALLKQKQMDHSVAAQFKDTNKFYMKFHTTKSGIYAVAREIFFSLDAKFCKESRCLKPMKRPARYLNVYPIMHNTKNVPGTYFQFNMIEAQNFFGTRPKWKYYGQHMMQNSCGEIKMITILRHSKNCDIHDHKLQCGRFTGDGANQHEGQADWNYHDFDSHSTRWISWVPGEEPAERKCVNVIRPERHLKITPITGARAIEQSMYFTYNRKEAEVFFQKKPKWKYSTTGLEMINSCGEKENLTIIRKAKKCTLDGKQTECGRITGERAGFHDWDYVHHEKVDGERWIAFSEDVVFVR